jgi:drug/metabolite transporter (DMT)-like permease
LGAIWGTSVMLQRLAVAEISPLPLVALRLLVAVAVFLPFAARLVRVAAARRRIVGDWLVIGALNPVVSGLFTALALQRASSGVVAVLQTLSPVLSALVVAAFLRQAEVIGWRRGLAMAVACGGVALLFVTGTSGLADGTRGDLLGLLFALGGPLAVALASAYVRANFSGTDPLTVAGGQIAAACLLAAPLAALVGGGLSLDVGAISSRAWVAVALSGGVGLSVSFVLFVHMIGRHGPTAALLSTYVMPVVAALLGVLFLGETITPPMLGGSALVLVGVLLFNRA